eukprot:2504916-Rhodomonas_salina.1
MEGRREEERPGPILSVCREWEASGEAERCLLSLGLWGGGGRKLLILEGSTAWKWRCVCGRRAGDLEEGERGGEGGEGCGLAKLRSTDRGDKRN